MKKKKYIIQNLENLLKFLKTKKVYILKKDVIEDDSDDEPIKLVKPKFKSQQKKKSVIKVTENSNLKNHIQYKNYFCD